MVILVLSLAHSASAGPPSDPLEPFNRAMYTFNDVFDRALVKPLATGYRYIIPSPVRRGVGNFFINLREPTTLINDLLQGKPAQARQTLDRFLLNSSIGLFGLIDIATPLGKPSHEEDYGQTLAVWGVPSGPYLVLPFLGPSSCAGLDRQDTGIIYCGPFVGSGQPNGHCGSFWPTVNRSSFKTAWSRPNTADASGSLSVPARNVPAAKKGADRRCNTWGRAAWGVGKTAAGRVTRAWI